MVHPKAPSPRTERNKPPATTTASLVSFALKWVYRFLARLDVAAGLLLVVLLLSVLGSCFPQVPRAVEANPEQLARWQALARARYGARVDFLTTIGLFHVYRSAVFRAALALLATSTLVCTVCRWRPLWRRVCWRPVACSDVAFDTAPFSAALHAPQAAPLLSVAREGLERRGFGVRQASEGAVIYLRGDRNRIALLATLVTHLGVLFLLLGAALSCVYGWREEITIDPGDTVEVGHGTSLALRNDGFRVVRYPDGTASGYEAQIAIVDGGHEVQRGVLRLNEPLVYRRIGVYLLSYEGTEGSYSVTVLAVRDPGYGLVVGAGFLLLLGLTVSFHFPHCWVHLRVGPAGALRLAGRAGRRAYDFGREFAALADELRQAAEDVR